MIQLLAPTKLSPRIILKGEQADNISFGLVCQGLSERRHVSLRSGVDYYNYPCDHSYNNYLTPAAADEKVNLKDKSPTEWYETT